MKYLYFQDAHAQGINSINRLGNYFEDWLIKFDELLSIAKQNKVDAILDGGDIFESPEPSYKIIDEIADRIEEIKIPIYSLFGNHAERYHSIEHSKYTGLSHLQKRSKYFRYLDKIEDNDYTIQGFEYKHDIEEDIKKNGLIITEEDSINAPKKIWRIAIVHAFICPEPFPYASHVVYDKIKTNADLILVGHYHKVWQKVIKHTHYLGIGCFGRLSVTEKDVHPSCVLINTDKRNYEIIPLKSAKKAEDCFNLEAINEANKNEDSIQEFIKSIESVSFQGDRIEDVITKIGKEQKVEKEIINLILDKTIKVQNES